MTVESLIRSVPLLTLGIVLAAAQTGCGPDAPRTSAGPASNSRPAASATSKRAEKPKPPAAARPASPKPVSQEDLKIEGKQEGVTFRWFDKGQVRMSARARELQGSEVSRIGTLLDFTAQLYENGQLKAVISAPKAVADTTKRIVTAVGGVTMKSMLRQTTVKCQWVRWYAKDQKVVGNGGVRADSTMGTMQGAAFEADTALKTLRVTSSARDIKL